MMVGVFVLYHEVVADALWFRCGWNLAVQENLGEICGIVWCLYLLNCNEVVEFICLLAQHAQHAWPAQHG